MKFGKKVLSMLLATGMVMSLAACGGNSDSAATTTDSSDNASAEAASDSAASGEVKTIRISHGQPETHPEHLGLLEFEKYIEENLGDKYQVEIYPNAIMGVTFEHVDKAPFQAILVPFTEEIIAEDEGLAAKYEQIKALAQ